MKKGMLGMAGALESRRLTALVLALALTAALVPVARPASGVGSFSDDDGNIHEAAIELIASLGITKGCNPPANSLYCPDEVVTRGQMAAFLVRTFGLGPGEADFIDTARHVFAADIESLAAAGITKGCNPPTNTRFCPDQPVTRGQMAAFLVRALQLTELSQTAFADTTRHVFEADTSRLAAAGITKGCNPPTNTRFCPDQPVLRDQMASFLSRTHEIWSAQTATSSTTTTQPSRISSSSSSSSTSTSSTTTSSTTSDSPSTTTPVPAGSMGLRIVSDPGRHNNRPLAGSRVAGMIYIVGELDPALPVDEVKFWIDDEDGSDAPVATEGSAPWDLAGTDTDSGDALPWNSAGGDTALSDGWHTITATAYASGGSELASATASFTIDNNGPTQTSGTDQVHLSWTGDTATSMTVVWRTDSTATASQVRWRKAGTDTWATVAGGKKDSGVAVGTLHEATITGLAAATQYEFQVAASGGGWAAIRTFETAPRTEGVLEAVYFADTGLAGRTDGLGVGVLQSISEMDDMDPDLLLSGGDYAYNARGNCDASDGRFGTGTAGLNQAIDQWFRQMDPLINDTPMMPTYGNHEVLLCEGFPAWADRFATPTGVAGPDPGPNQHGYDPPAVDSRGSYSFDVGPVHFISLMAVTENSAIHSGLFDWLEQDIVDAAKDGAHWIIPYFHATPISHGDNHFTNTALRNQLAPLFEDHDIPLVIFSHDQSYERTYPITNLNGGGPKKQSLSVSCYTEGNPGVVWLKVSPSGKHSNKSESFSPWRVDPPSWVANFSNTLHHFTRLTTTPTELRVRTYGHDGLGSAAMAIDDFSIKTGGC